ncbi:MAG: enolase, partial [Rhodoferax sp.]
MWLRVVFQRLCDEEEVFHALKVQLKSNEMITAVGNEGEFAPNLPSNSAALDALMNAI